MNNDIKEPFTGLVVGIVLMIIVFLVAHFVFGLEAFS
ncbi:hypothetical protein BpOF4_05230 [Alkalihalophilus pseudofirmus OF4]|uniref:Uncharacterized protein n=1 Tax=Alkalihalophilus pseudofirmus (strain ATCC BAA-2126 / JCM 17055 / OF4) TaxID=398511 RepID=D3FY85_ALKPO|nr:hypothetical protein BpOF4_05230 [Alkalihalophilus pseudofirmus OF4]